MNVILSQEMADKIDRDVKEMLKDLGVQITIMYINPVRSEVHMKVSIVKHDQEVFYFESPLIVEEGGKVILQGINIELPVELNYKMGD